MFGNGTAAVQEDGLDDENRMPNYGITAEDRQRIRKRHFEVMQDRQAASGGPLTLALTLARALRQQQGEG
ncbi:hypothetical protein AL472_22235 [Bordetella bronchiseptica]|nr:hypothetical protein AL472_22235 [Bordetella bronchiseptica]